MDKSDQIKKELEDLVNKAVFTTGVGEIAEIESFVGFLWGHGKKDADLSKEEKECRQEWEQIRKIFFDKMHDWVRKINRRLNTLEYQEKTYTYTFINIRKG